MIVSVPELGSGRVPDVCIIGSGPAGMTLAVELHRRGKDVLVLEAGGREITGESQDIYRGQTVGDKYYDLESARLRALGGSSNHWAGWCRPLDAIDFEPRDMAPDTGWPITKSHLDPYIAATKAILELEGSFEQALQSDAIREIGFLYSSPPVRFGEKSIGEFEHSERLTLCLSANVTGLETQHGQVTVARVNDYEGKGAQVRAGAFVLACGGIENSRLLLHFNAQAGGQLVPRAETLGCYWMEHLVAYPGEAVMNEPIDDRRQFVLTADKQRELQILNSRIRIETTSASTSHARALARTLACQAPSLGAWIYDRMGRNLRCAARIVATWEQEPRRDNRIILSETDRDAFGVPRPVLHWTRSTLDRRTLDESVLVFGEFLARSGLGRFRMTSWMRDGDEDPRDGLLGGWHHMGGTRMSQRAGEGIVNADLRVWGQDNLYVAGSSVFPSGGQAGPTFTIVQLSLRLAKHLSRRL